MSFIKDILNLSAQLFHRPYRKISEKYLKEYVESLLNYRREFISLAVKYGSPLYILDEDKLRKKAQVFKKTFAKYLNRPEYLNSQKSSGGPEPSDRIDVFYAMKSNNFKKISEIMVQENIGLDVSSGLELEQALACGSKKIVFSGPGKTEDELKNAVLHADVVTILIDSFNELKLLNRTTQIYGKKIRAGIRLTTNPDGLWRKFGIPLSSLRQFFEQAAVMPFVKLEGLQFHTSWNLSPDAQTAFIEELGKHLNKLPVTLLHRIKFLDIGGGFWPEQGEWLRSEGTVSGKLRNLVFPGRPDIRSKFFIKSFSLDNFAERIAAALDKFLPVIPECRIYMEPGRWICHECMHILIKVIDVKYKDLVITDAGTNAVGWERFENDYFPVINLTHPGSHEQNCHILGSLCTPHDVWGYSYHGTKICAGDLLLIPDQGAYTYSLRQNFIKPLPQSVVCL